MREYPKIMFKLVDSNNQNFIEELKSSQFIELLKTKWNELHNETGVFRYRIDNLQEKIVDGKYLLQLNPDRGSIRRTPEQIDDICQPFDENKFNFAKVSPKEILYNIVQEGNESDIHSLLVNVSPISQYHSLFCPSLSKCLPQIVTQDSLEICLEIMFLSTDRALRIGFNSLCGLASVNHLHYHLFLENNILPVEIVKCKQIKGHLYCLENYPAPAFAFDVSSNYCINEKAKAVYKLLKYFLKNSIAHNIFITRGDCLVPVDDEAVRVLVWPRKSSSGAKQLAAFNIAVCELSGWFPVYNKHDYENLTTKELEDELKKWTPDNFEELCEDLKLLF